MVEYSNIGKQHLIKTFKRMNDAHPYSFTQKKSAKCFWVNKILFHSNIYNTVFADKYLERLFLKYVLHFILSARVWDILKFCIL